MFDGGPLPHEPIGPWRSLKQKLDRNALLKDRLKALGAFTGIAIGAISGFEMVIGGGFDFMTPSPEVREIAPSRYVTVQHVPWSSQAQITPLSSTEPLFAGDLVQVETASDQLAGGYDDPDAPDVAPPAVNEDEIRAQIAALYANDAGPAYEDAPITYRDAPANGEAQAQREPDPYAEAEAMVREALGGHSPPDAALQPS
jgi:hypothetical protein